VEDLADESDDSYSLLDDDDDSTQISETDSPTPSAHSPTSTRGKPIPSTPVQLRERKASLPLTAKSLVIPTSAPTLSSVQPDSSELMTPNQHIKKLVKLAQEVNALDSDDIAQEITRLEAKLFLNIEVRLSVKTPRLLLSFYLFSLDIGFNTRSSLERRTRIWILSRVSTTSQTILLIGQLSYILRSRSAC
jgi:hypothetical protein